ncbi:MAG: S9 family peptidase [Bacteroidota bacterium]
MRKITIPFFILCFSLFPFLPLGAQDNLVIDGIPEIPKRITDKLVKYTEIKSSSLADWAPGGNGILFSTRAGDVGQIHLAKMPGSVKQQITTGKEPITSALSSPDPKRNVFIYFKDAGGNENFQLILKDLKSGKETMLSDGKSRYEDLNWNRKGDQIAYTCNKRNGKDMDVYVMKVDSPASDKMVLKAEGGGWSISDWSEDGKTMIIKNYVSVNESHIYFLDLATGKLDKINAEGKKINHGQQIFTKDGKGFYFVSDEDSEFSTLRYYDIKSKKAVVLTPKVMWDVEGITLSDDNKWLVFELNEGGWSTLYLFDTAKKTYTQIKNMPKCNIGAIHFHPVKNQVALTYMTSFSASEVYVIDLGSGNAAAAMPERWTFSEAGDITELSFVEPSLIHFPSHDGKGILSEPGKIPAFVYKPAAKNQDKLTKYPVVINIHGGPEGQSKGGFYPFYQYLVNELNTVVIVPNVRGSTGYGKTYVTLDNGFSREDAVKDIGSLLDWIAQQPDLDPARVGVWGGSYGGYMTLACMTHFNDRLKAGCDVVGISNFLTFLKNTSEYRRDLRRVEYGDERDPEMYKFLEKISPNNNVHKISKPMFIAQGANDPRVPASEAEQMVQALKKKNVTCWYLLAKDEGHGFKKKSNADYFSASLILFFEEYVIK